MEPPSQVVAFCDSPSIRETLAVVLEDTCHLDFVRAEAGVPADLTADLALVATRAPAPLLHDLTQRWPTLPVVAVTVGRSEALPNTPLLHTVPLEPHAIRSAVLHARPEHSGAALRMLVQRVAQALQAELTYAFAALRSFAALDTGAGDDTFAILGALAAEQCHAIIQSADRLDDFLSRPRTSQISPHFVAVLCDALEHADDPTTTDPVLYEYTAAAGVTEPPGPVNLAPVVAGCLRAYLRRRAAAPLLHIHTSATGIAVRFAARPSTAAVTGAWPLLLASLALAPCAWEVTTALDGHEEIVHVHPVV